MKEKLVNPVLLVASIIFCLLALEVGLRAYHGEWKYTNFRYQYLKRDYPIDLDTELGWIPKQDAQGVDPHTWRTPATILKDGIRSNGGGEVRDANDSILAVGDSFTFGLAMSDWETWPAQLEKLSGRRVINAGVTGYGIDQAFLRARRLLNRYSISTVIFSFIPDDIRRCQLSISWGAAKPYFDFKDGQLTEYAPGPLPAPPPRDSGLFNVLEHSRLVHAVMKRLLPEWWLPERWLGRQSWFVTRVHDEENGKEVACALLHELESVTKSHASKLIVLIQHPPEDTISDLMAVERVLSCLSDPATRVLDLKSALSELKAKDPSRYQRLYLPDAGHMSAEGNQFVALEILKILTQGEAHDDRGVLSPVRQSVR
jgi:lysophospholipase L1-like esterase